MNDAQFDIGIDIGGTHTDVVVEEDGIRRFKVPTTSDRLRNGVLNGLRQAATAHDHDLDSFLNATRLVVHGTTVSTNALLEGDTATTGLVTTAGFRDVLERNMSSSSDVYDLRREPSLALLPRYLRRGIPERVGSDGEVLEPLNVAEADRVIDELVDDGVEAIAVSLLSAYANDEHERQLRDRLNAREELSAMSVSTEINQKVGLYDRSVATIVDASLKPAVREYLRTLESDLRTAGFSGTLLIMQGNGGVTSADLIADQPIMSVNSGPAAGAVSAAYHADLAGFSQVISFEMGGTSSDVCLVPDGEPLVSTDNEVGETPIPLPIVDINTIGAGGGSIAWIDDRNVLQVGPRSAGSDPGPACYGLGGEAPTVTDANLVLGYLNPDYFLGGTMTLDSERARDAIERRIADPLGVSIEKAARGIRKLANENIGNQIRKVSIERGYDPREFVLVAGGGAGPVHVAAIANQYGTRAFVPRVAGTFSSLGLLESDIKHDFTRSVLEPMSDGLMKTIEGRFDEMERTAAKTLANEGNVDSSRSFQYHLDTRYDGQVHELSIPVSEADSPEAIERRHHRQHASRYGFADEDGTIEVVNARLTAYVRTGSVGQQPYENGVPSESAIKGYRSVYFTEVDERVEATIYDGTTPIRDSIVGPAVVEFEHTTLPIPSTFESRTDSYGNYILEPDV